MISLCTREMNGSSEWRCQQFSTNSSWAHEPETSKNWKWSLAARSWFLSVRRWKMPFTSGHGKKSSIYSCKALIELLCEKEEAKLQYTHFISVPLAYDDKFRQLVDGFREDVVLQRFAGIDASIFMPSQRMHFTLCMLKLHSHAQVEEMKEALKDLSARLAATSDYARSVFAHMKGLHIFTDDPTSVGVVFTTDRSSALQNRMNSVADLMFELFQARNLVSAQNLMSQRLLSSDGQHAEVKLHATLMNTKYAKSRFEERPERENFDASVLMERFGQVDFGAVELKELHLSSLDEMGDNGFYRCLASIPLSGS
mmetsp:Transcript_18938/g.42751  ORF Transcript_18938/g.42751 Transcript_18938/m.42751 type:complete len:312 (+) Transcript_18938:211-1146(+)